MKKNVVDIITGAAAAIAGLLIAFGPHYIFPVDFSCNCCDAICIWSAKAELGMGLIIAALGLCMLVFPDPYTQLGLCIGIFLAGLFGLLIPHVIIGGCEMRTMSCHQRAFPALTVICSVVLAGTAFTIWRIAVRRCPNSKLTA